VVGATVALALIALVVAPAVLHNVRHGAGPSVSTNNERNVILANSAYTPNYKTSQLAQRPLERLDPETRQFVERVNARNDRVARKEMLREAWAFVRAHPITTAWRISNRFRSFWGFDYVMSRRMQDHFGLSTAAMLVPLALEAGGYAIVACLALVGAAVVWRELDPSRRTLLWATPLLYMAPHLLAFSAGTYHFPVVPLLFPLAAAGASLLLDPARRATALHSRRLITAIAVFTIVQVEYAYFAIVHF
jgi:hypothetical protein